MFRMIATTAPTDAQANTVDAPALAAVVAQAPEDRRREVYDRAYAEIRDALAGRPVRESAARMVAKALDLAGCGCVVVPV